MIASRAQIQAGLSLSQDGLLNSPPWLDTIEYFDTRTILVADRLRKIVVFFVKI